MMGHARNTSGPPGLRRHPDPTDDLDRLGDAIAELAARIQAATGELLVLIRDFDDRRGWAHGFRSCAHWLNWRTGLDLGAARETASPTPSPPCRR